MAFDVLGVLIMQRALLLLDERGAGMDHLSFYLDVVMQQELVCPNPGVVVCEALAMPAPEPTPWCFPPELLDAARLLA